MPPKKAAKHHEEKHEKEKDLRRAYEHFGRVEILQRNLGALSEDVAVLVAQAQQEARRDAFKNAAELLRAAEHLSFSATLTASEDAATASGPLLTAIQREFERLKTKAEEREEEGLQAVSRIYSRSLKKAQEAFAGGAYHKALELVRAAEALTHVKPSEKAGKGVRRALETGKEPLPLSL